MGLACLFLLHRCKFAYLTPTGSCHFNRFLLLQVKIIDFGANRDTIVCPFEPRLIHIYMIIMVIYIALKRWWYPVNSKNVWIVILNVTSLRKIWQLVRPRICGSSWPRVKFTVLTIIIIRWKVWAWEIQSPHPSCGIYFGCFVSNTNFRLILLFHLFSLFYKVL